MTVKTLFSSKPKRLAKAVKIEGNKINGPSGTLDVYALPLKAQSMEVEGCQCSLFGQDFGKKNRTIMFLGATGAGKSTLVNRMINYILGVEWDDTFRFKLVDESTAISQTQSQTSEVNVYKLYHREGFKIDYSLTIVDTPGFGDTRGIARDKLIMTQLENVFSAKYGIREIDAICFVAPAFLSRLTPTQKYIFDSVLAIFGKDVAENIRILVTFADVKKPLVLEAIKVSGLPCPTEENGLPIHFKFNNSDKMTPGENNEDEDSDDGVIDWDKKLWDMGTKNMNKFFSALNVIETKSLTLTKEVLRQRAQLHISIEDLNRKVKFGLTKLEEIKKESETLKDHESTIKANGDFDYIVNVTRPVQVKCSTSSLNCGICNVTCHKSCGKVWGFLYFCEAFDGWANCVICEGKCAKRKHVFNYYYWDTETVSEKRTYKELKKKYEMASKDAMSIEDIIKQMELEYDHLQDEVVKLMECSAQCLSTLKEIALRPDPLSTPEYIDLLIEQEKSDHEHGFMERIEKLGDMKRNAITIEKVASGAPLGSIY
ncbi:unnamed protein product [Boreogadus saida]